ncbi:MAG: prepilin-type N-terminal cleavage/methylation domain-containing protein [Vicinamibacteria bacterium]
MSERGHSLVEMVVVVAILMLCVAAAAPALRAYSVESQLIGVGMKFKMSFLRARSIAARRNTYTAIRFERRSDGVYYSLYVDGNANGVDAADIQRGVDKLLEGPFLLTTGAPDVRVAVDPGTPAIPPDSGFLDTGDAIRFGRSDTLSFSPLGTATPGTFYLAGVGAQAAVRVTPLTARVRIMVCRGGRWSER